MLNHCLHGQFHFTIHCRLILINNGIILSIQASVDTIWKETERHGRQLGNMNAIYNTQGKISIIYPSDTTASAYYQAVALDLSRNIFQYFGADTEIIRSNREHQADKGNVVYLGFPEVSTAHSETRFPIILDENNDLVLVLHDGYEKKFRSETGIGAIFVIPLEGSERVGIVIWGSDEDNFRRAMRLFPLRTGVGQPDFIILGPESAQKGIAGALALGFFDSEWQITRYSFFR